MFTGLVREIGRVASVQSRRGITRLECEAPVCSQGIVPGDSLAVNGVCLTVTAVRPPRVIVEATAETRRVTTVPRWRVNDPLHLEPALRLGDAVGGHLVYGHVDGTGRILRLARRRASVSMTVGVPESLARRLVPKGAIAVDGVSLTLDSGPFDGRFTVTLVPYTLARTRFGSARAGDHVNIELDFLAKSATRPLTAERIVARGWAPPGSGGLQRT